MKLDPKGLEAAREQIGTNHDGIIRAYLTALTPAEVGGLVERLREGTFGSDITKTDAYLNGLMREAATALEAQAAELAKFDFEKHSLKVSLARAEAQLAEAMKVIEPFADVAEWDIGDSESDDDIFRPMDGRNSVAGLIRVGHLRAARKFLKENGNG